MKFKFLFFTALTILAVIIGFDLLSQRQKSQEINQKVLGQPTELAFGNITEVSFGNQNYRVAWYKVPNLDRLFLLPNFEAKLGSREVKEKENCEFLVSGGFYSKEGRPTGFFASEGQVLQDFIPNKLLPGVVSINSLATPRITSAVPQDELRLGLQAGPILKENSFASKLSLAHDENARRVVAAITGQNELYFLIFWDPNSFFRGPLLTDLPPIIGVFERETGLEFADALNLDGGSATAFYSADFQLSEGTKVGSFFCVKD
jgi:uncharacterized protein YigE (DUF2233 family)